MDNPIPPLTGQSPPMAVPAQAVVPRSVDAGRGGTWWSEAWRLFTPAAGTWLVTVVVLFLFNVVLTFVPLVGHVAGQVIFPAIVAGLMLGCRSIDRGQGMTLNHLFAGFSERGGPLIILGVIYTVLVLAIVAVVFGVLLVGFGAAVLSQLWNLQDPMAVSGALGSILFAVLVGMLLFLLLYLPLVMAIWFAPALVVFRNMDPWAAMKASFAGSMVNVVPFLVYGVVGVVLAIVASIPLMLGWLVLLPVSVASIYTSYCDIYEDAQVATPATSS